MTLDENLKKIETDVRKLCRTDYFEFCVLLPKQTGLLHDLINEYNIDHCKWNDCLANINSSINCLNSYAKFNVFTKDEEAQQRNHQKKCKKSFSSLIRLFKTNLKEMNYEHLLKTEIV